MKEQGIVYVLTNPCMHGIVRIGMTERKNIEARLKELYTTGVPLPFETIQKHEKITKRYELRRTRMYSDRNYIIH